MSLSSGRLWNDKIYNEIMSLSNQTIKQSAASWLVHSGANHMLFICSKCENIGMSWDDCLSQQCAVYALNGKFKCVFNVHLRWLKHNRNSSCCIIEHARKNISSITCVLVCLPDGPHYINLTRWLLWNCDDYSPTIVIKFESNFDFCH